MERKLFFLLASGLVFSAAILSWSQTTQAALCDKCRDLMFIDSEGKCSQCGGPTASGALQLCPKCSAKRHQCEHCLAPLSVQEESAGQSKPADPPPEKSRTANSHGSDGPESPPPSWTAPAASHDSAQSGDASGVKPAGPEIDPLPPMTKLDKPAPQEISPVDKPPADLPPGPVAPPKLKPINPAKVGTYTAGKWRYQMQITNPGTRSEGRWGWLTYDNQKLPRGDVNDYYNTPWGQVFWVDVPTTAWGVHGWMPVPLSQNRRQGRTLTLPAAILTPPTQSGNGATRLPPPTAPGAAAPPSQRMTTLEINKSHNGQLAKVRVGNVLIIRLPGNPASGYQWQAGSKTTPVVRLTVRPQYSPPAAVAQGATAPGYYTFIFQAVQPGSGSIHLYYISPNDPGRPRDSFAVGVSVSPATTARPALPVSSQGAAR